MTRALLCCAALAVATPALSQQPDPHAGHQMPAQPPPDPHAGHDMPAEPQPAELQPADPHAGHSMPAEETAPDPHAGHAMGPPDSASPQPGSAPAAALAGPAHAADAHWGQSAMERGRNILREEHGSMPATKFLVDRAEARFQDGRDAYLFDLQAWYGGDTDKLWLKSEVEGPIGGKREHAEFQALWSHAITPWFDLQAGGRLDSQPGPNRTHLALGVQGLAPYWWEVEGTMFFSNKGEVTARAEAEYDLRITQKLILQPRVEVELAAEDIPELGIGSGLGEGSLGLRLRYQISPLVAPYIGVEYEHSFGNTRDFRRAEGEKADGVSLLAGMRFWL